MAGIENEEEFANEQMTEVETIERSDAGSQLMPPSDGTSTTVEKLKSLHSTQVSSTSADQSENREPVSPKEGLKTEPGPEETENAGEGGEEVVEPAQPAQPATILMSAEDIKQVLISGLLQKTSHQLKRDFGQGDQLVSEVGVLLQSIDIKSVRGEHEDTPIIYWQPLARDPDEAVPIATSMDILQRTVANARSGNHDGTGEDQNTRILPTMEEIGEFEQNAGQLLDEKSGSCQTVRFSNDPTGVKFITSDGVPCFRVLMHTYLIWNKIAHKIRQNLLNLTMTPIACKIRGSIDRSLSSAKEHLFNMVVKHVVVAEWGIVDLQMFCLAMSDVCECIKGSQPTSGTMIRGRRKNLMIIKELIEHDSSE